MQPNGFVCKQCGKCCLNFYDAYQHSVDQSDVEIWQNNARDDILAWVDPLKLSNGRYIYDVWINQRTHDDVERCQWLRKLPGKDKYICRIHDVKPSLCRNYPKSKKQAKEGSCKGFTDRRRLRKIL